MSDHARNYVKNLENSRLRPPQKSFLFFLADYHSVQHSKAWPSLQTLAEDTGLSLRYIRGLVAQCVELGIIAYVPGLGRGNKGCFRFLELDTPTVELNGDRNEGRKGDQKGDQKGDLHDNTIRNEPEPEPEPGTEDQHACGAMKIWLKIKTDLKTELPESEWKLWVRPTRLIRVMDQTHLVLAMPPSRAIVKAAHERKSMLRGKLAKHGYSFGFTKYPDDWERGELASMGWEFTPKQKPVEGVA